MSITLCSSQIHKSFRTYGLSADDVADTSELASAIGEASASSLDDCDLAMIENVFQMQNEKLTNNQGIQLGETALLTTKERFVHFK